MASHFVCILLYSAANLDGLEAMASAGWLCTYKLRVSGESKGVLD